MVKDGKKSKKDGGGDDVFTVMSYFEKMNRPYNAQILSDNLQGTIGKTTLNKILQTLTDDGKLTCKEFGKQKLYWRNQELLQVEDKEELSILDKKLENLEEELEKLNEECSKLSSELKTIITLPTNSETEIRIKTLSTENTDLEEKLKLIKGKSIVITPEEKKKAEKDYDSFRLQWKKRKRMCKEIVDQLTEASGKKAKDLIEEVGVTTDEEAGVSLERDKTTKMKKGEC